MKSDIKILLINYTAPDANRISKELGIEAHRGFLADSGTYIVDHSGVSEPVINFVVPESFAEYKCVFINFSIPEIVKKEYGFIEKQDFKNEGREFLGKYWFKNQGYLVIFSGKDMVGLKHLSLPIESRNALNTDKTAHFRLKEKDDNPLRVTLKKLASNIQMPATHYLSLRDDKLMQEAFADKCDIAYVNSSDDAIGLYLDQKTNEYNWNPDVPQALVLPTFKSISNASIELVRCFAQISPKFLPLTNSDWAHDDSYYPSEVASIERKIVETVQHANDRVEELTKEKKALKEQESAYIGILTETDDKLVDSVSSLLISVLDLTVVDVDKEEGEGTSRKEDLLITFPDSTKILAEVKGTKSRNPSPKYIGQATNHYMRKVSSGASKCMLVINHDLKNEPATRSEAYKGEDEILLNSFDYVSYLDTRVLHRIVIDVKNGDLSKDEAIEILKRNGRIAYP